MHCEDDGIRPVPVFFVYNDFRKHLALQHGMPPVKYDKLGKYDHYYEHDLVETTAKKPVHTSAKNPVKSFQAGSFIESVKKPVKFPRVGTFVESANTKALSVQSKRVPTVYELFGMGAGSSSSHSKHTNANIPARTVATSVKPVQIPTVYELFGMDKNSKRSRAAVSNQGSASDAFGACISSESLAKAIDDQVKQSKRFYLCVQLYE